MRSAACLGLAGLFRPVGRNKQNVFTAESFYVINPPERFCPRLEWGRSFLLLSIWCEGLETEAGKEKKKEKKENKRGKEKKRRKEGKRKENIKEKKKKKIRK